MKTFKVRLTKPSDYKNIRTLLLRNGMIGSYFTPALFRRLLKRNKGLYFVAESKGKIIGNLFSTHDGGYCAYLYKMCVDSNWRRSSVATELNKAAITKLRKFNIVGWVFCHVRKNNKISLKFCKSLGLEPLLTHYVVDGIIRQLKI